MYFGNIYPFLTEEEIKKAHFFAKRLKAERNLTKLKSQLISEGIDVDYLVEKSGRRFAAVKINNVRFQKTKAPSKNYLKSILKVSKIDDKTDKKNYSKEEGC